jgi:L-serine deaminase
MDDKKVDEAARVLRDLREALSDAEPDDLRGLFQSLFVKVEVQFSHTQQGGRTVNTPIGGTIVVRPPARSSILFRSRGF